MCALNNRALYSQRVRDYRRGYAITISHVYSSDPGGILCHQISRRQHRQQPPFVCDPRERPTVRRARSIRIGGRFPPQPVGRIDVGHVQLVIRLSRRPPLPELPWRGCSVPASRTAFRNACARAICRPHARSRAPARAGRAPSRDRPVLGPPERQPGAHTRAHPQAWCRRPLWHVPVAA